MHVTDRFSVAGHDDDAGTCTLALDGQPIASRFDGREMEAQYVCGNDRFLLCTSMGTGWDDVFTLYLLDHAGRTLDAIAGGGLMSSGVFRAIACRDDVLDFTCFSDRVLRLSITPSPQLRALSPAPWRYRNLLSRHYLALRELPPGASHD